MWSSLDWQAWVTLGVVILMMVALIKELAQPDMVFLGSLGLLLLFGILTPEEAFKGLSNPAVLAVGSLFVVAVGVQNTGALGFVDQLLFTRSAGFPGVLPRLMVATASMSAFLNNTPVVAMLIPRVQAWCEETGLPTSKLLIPLSYASIVGGMTTLIGTSTNLLVSGLMEASGYEGLGLFDLSWIGLPAAVGAILYFRLIGHRLLPDRSKERTGSLEKEVEEYLFEVRVASNSALIGQTVQQSNLRALGDAYMAHLSRDGEIFPASPEMVFRAGDVLTFRGNASMLDRLLAHPGFERVIREVETKDRRTLPLYEAVVAPSSALVGQTLRQADFRAQFQGVVLGIHRRDTQIDGSLRNVPIRSGDLLLIEAPRGFDKRWKGKQSGDFYLVAPRRAGVTKPQKDKAPLALLILLGVVIFAAIGLAPIATTAFVGALAMIATRCIDGREARQALDFSVLIVIASALGIGHAIEHTGLANAAANSIISTAITFGPIGVLVAVYLLTALLTELITNNAAAALMLAIGLATARNLEVAPKAFAIAIAIAASASFLTPIGYQTNLMVMSAGDYRFFDYTRAGILVNLLVGSVTVTIITLMWL